MSEKLRLYACRCRHTGEYRQKSPGFLGALSGNSVFTRRGDVDRMVKHHPNDYEIVTFELVEVPTTRSERCP